MLDKIKIKRFDNRNPQFGEPPFVADVILSDFRYIMAEFFYPHGQKLIPVFYRNYSICFRKTKFQIFSHEDKLFDYYVESKAGNAWEYECCECCDGCDNCKVYELSKLQQLLPRTPELMRQDIISHESSKYTIDKIDYFCGAVTGIKVAMIRRIKDMVQNLIEDESTKAFNDSSEYLFSREHFEKINLQIRDKLKGDNND
jgi:hypothetical protein